MRRRGRVSVGSWLVGALAGFLVFSLGPLAAAQAPQKPQQGSFAEDLMREIERARRQVETLYVLRLSETLALNPEQSAQMATIVRKAHEARRGLLEERRQTLQDLSTLLAVGAGADRIKPRLVQWEQNEARLGRWRQTLFQDLSRILSVEQQGRFVLFDENFNTEVRNAVQEVQGSGPAGAKQ